MSIVYDVRNDKTTYRIYCKGAPDVLLEKCSHYINKSGSPTIMN